MAQPSDSPYALQIEGLRKRYGDFEALKGIDLHVEHGEVFGFLGPNGAGKTTTIRCVLDMIRPSAGTIRVLGIDPQADPVAVQRKLGYLPGELRLDDNLTARQILKLFDAFRGHVSDWDYVLSVAARLSLDLDKPIKNFSKGNKQKVGVVQAFMHQPQLLVLDEPTSGLDPLMQQEVIGLVREANARGSTVFFSSHFLSEVEAASDRVAIVREGEIVEVTSPAEFTARSLRTVRVTLASSKEAAALDRVAGVRVVQRVTDRQLRLQIQCKMDTFIKTLSGLKVEDVEIEGPSLEEVFLAYYERNDQPRTQNDGAAS